MRLLPLFILIFLSVAYVQPSFAQGLITDIRDKIEDKINKSEVVKRAKDKIKEHVNSVKSMDSSVQLSATNSVQALTDINASVDNNLRINSEKFEAHPSLFFRKWQRENIYDVRNSQGEIYEAYLLELEQMRKREKLKEALQVQERMVQDRQDLPKPPEETRFIHLQGILFSSADKWVVYLNGMKITPEEKPNYIVQLNVTENYAEIQWYDEYTNKIIPVRLKPLQRFHMDSRTFVPGNS